MTDEELSLDGVLAEAVTKVTAALELAATEHGQAGVDLALLAYRVDAIQGLALGAMWLLSAAGCGLLIYAIWRLTEAWLEEDRVPARVIAGMVVGVGAGIFLVVGMIDLLRIPHWMAAFGYPEVLIATRALQAAGLM